MTLKDIAELANTSVSTVSRSLNDSELISAATRERIKAIAAEQGFQFNAIARGLATSTVGTIGVILPEHYDRFDVLMYHAALHSDMRKSIEQADLDTIVAFTENRFSGLKNIERLVTRGKVDGLIIVRSSLDEETLNFLRDRQVPFVLTHYPPDDPRADDPPPEFDMIWSDNREGGRMVAEYLRDLGATSVAILSGGDDRETAHRLEGFRTIMDPVAVLPCGWQIATATSVVQDQLASLRRADAVFAMNDLMAFGALQAFTAAGVHVPRDLLLLGYDDTPLATSTLPGITSVHQAHEEIALLACELLLDQIQLRGTPQRDVRQPRYIAIQPRLTERESTRRES